MSQTRKKESDYDTRRWSKILLAAYIAGQLFCLNVFSGPALTVAAVEVDQNDAIEIVVGKEISRELETGHDNRLRLAAARGQVFKVIIDKGDAALSVAVNDPTGTKLFEQISRRYERLEIVFGAATAGAYDISIHNDEHANGRRGYTIRIAYFAEDVDLPKYESAQKELAAAAALSIEWTQGSLSRAAEKYERAAELWRSARDNRRAVQSFRSAAEIHFRLSEYQAALDRYKEGAQLAASSGLASLEASCWSGIGWIYSYTGDNRLARSFGIKALETIEQDTSREVRDDYALALSNFGEVNYSMGDFVRASRNFQKAREIFTEIGDREGQARVHLFKGYLAGSLGDAQKAHAEFSAAQELYRSITNPAGEALCTMALGMFYSATGDEDRAIKSHRAAIDAFRSVGDQHSEAIGLMALGQAYMRTKGYSIALVNLEQALKIFEHQGAQESRAGALFKIAQMHRMSGNVALARSFYEQSIRLSHTVGNSRTAVNALQELTSLYASRGERAETLKQFERIRQFYDRLGDRRGVATTLNNAGEFLFRLGETKKALDFYLRALPLSEAVGDSDVLLANLFNLAQAYSQAGDLDTARSHIERSLKLIEDERTNLASPDVRTSYFSQARKHYDLCLDILMRFDRSRPGEGFAAAALIVSEKARARSLVDLVANAHGDWRRGAPETLINRERELRALLRSEAQYLAELSRPQGDASEASEVAAQIAQLQAEYQELQSQLRNSAGDAAAFAMTTVKDVKEIQVQLRDEDSMLLEYALGDERSYLWAISQDSMQVHELPARQKIEEAAMAFYQSLTARQQVESDSAVDYSTKVAAADDEYARQAQRLSQMLLGPVADRLNATRTIIVSEGALQYVPFDALPIPNGANSPSALMLDAHEIVTLPSFSTLVAIRSQKSKAGSTIKIAAVFADPVFSLNDNRLLDRTVPNIAKVETKTSLTRGINESAPDSTQKDTPRLAHAAEEADAVMAAVPAGRSMVAKDFDANFETATDPAIGQYQILHFATHSLLNSKHPELSGIVLSMVDRQGARKNGLMLLNDIYGLNLSAQVTVLSACDTALGADMKGEGLVGLTHGFMSAGSQSVVASLWRIDDRATASLMADFYRSMLQQGMRPAAALRAAKLKTLQQENWKAPYFWAGFEFQGEYRNQILVEPRSSRLTRLILLVVAIMSLITLVLFFARRSHIWRRA